jgi:hypothetical protein
MLNLGLGVNSRHSVSLYDADALAFINATALTGTTEKTAVNNLVKNLKSYGLWSKMKAIYPFVSDTINQFNYTEEFDNAYWGKARISVTANTIAAPNGTMTADSMVEDTTTNSHPIFRSITTTNATVYTVSIFAKQGSRQYLRINATNGGSPIYYDLLNKTAGAGGSIVDFGNGWCRLIYPYTTNSTSGEIYIEPSITNSTTTYLGNGSTSTYIWGAQLETGALTTYQPIATTPANRFVSQFKYNLKDARDLDAAFRLAFNGTWTYSKQGATPNGVNAYADSYLNQLTSLSANNLHLSYYSRTSTATSNSIELGVNNNSGASYNPQYSITVRNSTGNSTSSVMGDYNTNFAKVTSLTTSACYIIGSRTTSTVNKLYQNGSLIATDSTTNSTSANNYSFYIAASNGGGGGALQYSPKQVAFATIGNGLTDTEATNLYTSVQLFQQELSRYVGVPIVSDANAQAFLDAAVITDQTQANAVNTLVTDLKTYGLWTKMKAIYPFVGGTATTHKWNLKDPRDLDAAYRLAFSGAWTHSSTGALPNGANAYADTFLIPSTALTLNNTSFGYYSRTNSSQIPNASEMAVGSSLTQLMYLRTKNLSGNGEGYSYNTNPATVANANSQGLYNVSRITDSSLKLYKNGSLIASLLTTQTGTLPSNKFYLGAVNYSGTVGEYSNKESAFAYIGDGFSDTESANLYTAVQKYQTSLSRQV